MQLKNDASLARVLHIAHPRISKIRRGKLAISADVLLRSHEIGQIPLAELRQLMARRQ
jgi:plasmid maintenance system antidote protein VapI